MNQINNHCLCDNIIASHKFVVDLVDRIIVNEVLPEAKETAGNGHSDGLPIMGDNQDDLEWLEGIAKDVVDGLRKSEIAAIKSGTCIRRPSRTFGHGSALANPDWAREIASLHIDYDCSGADRLLAGLQIASELLIELFRRGYLQFKKTDEGNRKKEWFARMADRLTTTRQKMLSKPELKIVALPEDGEINPPGNEFAQY